MNKDKLTQIIKDSIKGRVDLHTVNMLAPIIADRLIEDKRIIVPPCKVGDMVYFIIDDIDESYISQQRINDVSTKGLFVSTSTSEENCYDFIPYSNLGKDTFLDELQAEKVLKERDK